MKTPLTSIISYIDLLKRENFEDAKVCEYLGILEQKAARLKVLTEDVVESKAITCIHQVIGEFEERFQERHLTIVAHFPPEATVIHADGQ
ncbi:MAG: histidine kinase dimerization/phospho-acceptor domain-containing protein [Blautia sp.]